MEIDDGNTFGGTKSVKAVIFDVDGTLYDQRKLRLLMFFDMVSAVCRDPKRMAEIRIIRQFRETRERMSTMPQSDIAGQQFTLVAKSMGKNEDGVRRVIGRWMFRRPLRYLPACRFPGLGDFFHHLKTKGIAVGIFSDYPAEDKLAVMGLTADAVVCATDPEVDRLKPDPKGLLVTARKLGRPPQDCLFIGDRDDKDGECARRAGMPYLMLSRPHRHFYTGDGLYRHVKQWSGS